MSPQLIPSINLTILADMPCLQDFRAVMIDAPAPDPLSLYAWQPALNHTAALMNC